MEYRDYFSEFIETWSPTITERSEMARHLQRILGRLFDAIERRAEDNMHRTGKLEGMHYAALREVRRELGIERKK